MSSTPATPARNWGIDLLRVVSMLFVVILHMLRYNNLLKLPSDSAEYGVAWFLEIMALCAVDIFALVSGYVTYRDTPRTFKFSSYINLWIQVTFYTFVLMFIGHIIYPDTLGIERVWQALFPVSTNQYWYFTAYTALFFLTPVLDAGLRGISVESARRIFLGFLIAFTFVPHFADSIGIDNGYNFAWLAILYVMGAIMKKARIGERIPALASLVGIFVIAGAAWWWKMQGHLGGAYGYAAFPIFAMAILWVLFFSRIRFGVAMVRVIKFSAPASFAIYIVNMHPTVMKVLYSHFPAELVASTPWLLAILVLGTSLAFVVAVILIDRARIWFFTLIRVPKLVKYVDEHTKRITTAISERL